MMIFLYSSLCLLNIFFMLLLGPYSFFPLLSPSLHEKFLWYLSFSWRYICSFPFYCFLLFSLHWSLRKAFLSFLAILWNSAFFPLPFTSLLFTVICKASLDNHFAFLHFFFLGMVLITTSCTMSWTSTHSSSGTLSIRSNPLNVFLTYTV